MASNESVNFTPSQILINRNLHTEKSFQEKYSYIEPKELCLKEKISKLVRPKENNLVEAIKKFILSVVPILYWLPRYKFKKWFLADFVSGLTVGIMHIPQGMSYALLAGQHPVYGLYNSFFPVILYSLLGTSRHTSMGTFALTSLMLGNAMASLAPDPVFDLATGKTADGLNEETAWNAIYDRRIILGSAVMFISGIFLFGLSILRVGFVVVYLSDPMISGFTFGAAVQILVSQFKSLVGVSIGSYAGPLNLIWMLRDLILALINLDEAGRTKTSATVVISVICIIFLVILKELNVKYKEKIPLGLPLPGEIVVVIVGTGISYGVNLAEKYGVSIIGNIPSGIPAPVLPAFNELSSLIGYAIPIAVVGYSVSVSIAKIFGSKFGYEIRPNQELVAYGVSNTVCSFFSCFPAFPSMSRSCVQVESGGKTQVVGLIAAAIILLVLLVIGPLFSSIPKACLASIICVAMKGMLKRALALKDLWKVSKLDFATWMVAAISTIFLDVVYGLCVGVGFTLLCIIFRTQLVDKEALERVGETEFYRKAEQYTEMSLHSGMCVGSFRGPLHYLNKEAFRKMVTKVTKIDPVMKLAKMKKAEKKLKKIVKADESNSGRKENVNIVSTEGVVNTAFTQIELSGDLDQNKNSTEVKNKSISQNEEKARENNLKYFILDCSQISFIDSVGAKVLMSVTDDYKKIGVTTYLSNCSPEILRVLTLSGYFSKFGDDVAFVSIHDAIIYAAQEIEQTPLSNEVSLSSQDITQL
uniref:solute carrier family 26 member 6-like n=1 Tax=Styela clava TaxID=7725 RepID=UPI001939FE22|nr:solute carrier family 26 member 6-like [Styela clava]